MGGVGGRGVEEVGEEEEEEEEGGRSGGGHGLFLFQCKLQSYSWNLIPLREEWR